MSDNDFHIRWDASALALLRSRIRGFEWPYNAADSGWRYGCDPDFLRRFCIHWADSYDIEAGEGTLNRYPQLLAEVAPGMRLHVVHVCGEAQGRRPLLLIHGWPGSVYQFWPLIDALAFPSRFGGAPMDARCASTSAWLSLRCPATAIRISRPRQSARVPPPGGLRA